MDPWRTGNGSFCDLLACACVVVDDPDEHELDAVGHNHVCCRHAGTCIVSVLLDAFSRCMVFYVLTDRLLFVCVVTRVDAVL